MTSVTFEQFAVRGAQERYIAEAVEQSTRLRHSYMIAPPGWGGPIVQERLVKLHNGIMVCTTAVARDWERRHGC